MTSSAPDGKRLHEARHVVPAARCVSVRVHGSHRSHACRRRPARRGSAMWCWHRSCRSVLGIGRNFALPRCQPRSEERTPKIPWSVAWAHRDVPLSLGMHAECKLARHCPVRARYDTATVTRHACTMFTKKGEARFKRCSKCERQMCEVMLTTTKMRARRIKVRGKLQRHSTASRSCGRRRAAAPGS
jgi:hypothetical protein